MEVTTYDSSGAAGPPTSLPADPFDGTVNEAALHQVITAILAHRRQGTAATKGRSQVRGGSRKPWRQKGTGRARQGTIRAAQWRGGGVVFGPQPRNYAVKVSRKLRQLATRSALNARALDGGLGVVEPLTLDAPSTKAIAAFVDALEADGNVLILTDGLKRNVHLSSRNLQGVHVLPWAEVSAYDVLWADRVLIESSALIRSSAAEGESG